MISFVYQSVASANWNIRSIDKFFPFQANFFNYIFCYIFTAGILQGRSIAQLSWSMGAFWTINKIECGRIVAEK